MKTNKDIKLTWDQLRALFRVYNELPGENGFPGRKEPLHAVAVFKSSNWPDDDYSLESRSYHFTSDNNAFKNRFSSSCYAEALDGSDPRVDIARYGWEVEYCYLL